MAQEPSAVHLSSKPMAEVASCIESAWKKTEVLGWPPIIYNSNSYPSKRSPPVRSQRIHMESNGNVNYVASIDMTEDGSKTTVYKKTHFSFRRSTSDKSLDAVANCQ